MAKALEYDVVPDMQKYAVTGFPTPGF